MILGSIKGEKLDERINEYRKAAALSRLVKIIKAIPVYKHMMSVIEERKLFFRRQHMSLVLSMILQIRFKRKLRIRGKNVKEREQITARNLLTFHGNAVHESQSEIAAAILLKFLIHTESMFMFSFKMTKFAKNVGWLIEGFQNGYKVRKQQINVFRNEIWVAERMKIWESFSGKLSKHVQQLKTKIQQTSEESQQAVQDLHIKRQKLQSDLFFMDWYIKESNKKKQKKPTMKFNRKYYRYIKTMDINMKKIAIIDDFLRKKVNKINVKKKSKEEGGLFITSMDPDAQPSHKKKDKKRREIPVIRKQSTLATAKRLTEIMNKYTLPIMPKFSLFQNNSDD